LYAIAFDMEKDEFDIIGYDIELILKNNSFERVLYNLYLTSENNLTRLYKVIDGLKQVIVFRKNVKDVRVFRISDWSDFTEIVKGD